MSSTNRAAKYEALHKALKKHFKPLPEAGERTVLEHLLYACCLENARAEHADEAFAKLQQAYFDWNEVRVTTAVELGEALHCLPNAVHAGHRIKKCLQALFEARYQYDIEDLKKANLSKAVAEIEAWKGVTPFILNYVSQQALGGHAIPAGEATLEALVQLEIITLAEAEKKTLPGVERAIPKTKGNEFSSLLHQFAMEFSLNPKNPLALAVFKEMGVNPKPKQVAPKVPEKKPASPKVAPPVPAPTTAGTKSKAPAVPVAPPTNTKVSPSTKKGVEPVATKGSDKKITPSTSSKPMADDKKGATKKSGAAKADAGLKPTKAETKPVVKKPDAPEAKKGDAKPPIKVTTVKSDTKKKPAAPIKGTEGKKKPTTKITPSKKPSSKKAAPASTAISRKITKKKPR